MKHENYSMAFTTGGLFRHESAKLAMLYLELNNWDTVRDKVLADNLLQARMLSASKRVCREIISRLKTLQPGELDLLAHGSAQEQDQLLWIAVCRRYKFIGEFAVEILRERHISLKPDLHYEDFDAFLHKKSEWHPELDKMRPGTIKKLRQVLFKIMREADLLTAGNKIKATMLSPRLLAAISKSKHADLLFFPVFESDLMGMAR